jgi:hypothetical protein
VNEVLTSFGVARKQQGADVRCRQLSVGREALQDRGALGVQQVGAAFHLAECSPGLAYGLYDDTRRAKKEVGQCRPVQPNECQQDCVIADVSAVPAAGLPTPTTCPLPLNLSTAN